MIFFTNFKNRSRKKFMKVENFLDLQTSNLQAKLKPEESSIRRILCCPMSTQNYIRLRQLIPVAVKLLK